MLPRCVSTTPAQPRRAERGGTAAFEDVSMPGNDPLEVPLEDRLERAPEGRAIRHGEPADQPARPEALPHAVRPEEQARRRRRRAMDVEAEIGDHEGPRRAMEEDHLVEPEALEEAALDAPRPRRGRPIGERGVEGERSPPPRRARRGQKLGGRKLSRRPIREPPVRFGDHDEGDPAQPVELLSELWRDGTGRMEDELSAVESDHRHAHGDRNQAGPPAELVLDAPQIGVVLDQRQRVSLPSPASKTRCQYPTSIHRSNLNPISP